MHPPEPIRDLTLDLNFDELLPIGVPTSVQVNGAERTSFYPAVEKTAAAFGLQIQPDVRPWRASTIAPTTSAWPASACRHSPSMKEISSPAIPRGWGKQQKEEYDAQRYHRPTDEYRADMDFRTDARLAQFGFLLGWQALSSAPVTWKPGDEFEAARKKSNGQSAQ